MHRAFLASVRILGEGVDIVGERGVEAVCFADTRGSQVEIVQNIGRALRPNPDGTTKVARIIVPVFLEPGEDPEDMIASASYAPLVALLQGLRSHDERLVEQLASRALTQSSRERPVHVQRDADGRIIHAGPDGEGDGEGEVEEGGTQAVVESALLHFSTPRDPATIAAFLRTRVYRPESLVWLDGFQALRRWREENEVAGLFAVPYDTETELGVVRFPLGRWVHQQRRAQRAGELDTHRKTLLDQEGMVWEPGDEAWETKLAALRSFRRRHGHLAPRQDAVWGETDGDLVAIGQLMANLRRTDGLGKDQKRARERAEQLTAIDEDWNCAWPLDWQRHYRVLADLTDTETDGSLPDIQPGVLFNGDDLGKWLAQQRRAQTWAQLSGEQQARLGRLGVTPDEPESVPVRARAVKGAAGGLPAPFRRGVTALAQWVEREGERPVPRKHEEPVDIDGQEHVVKLGVFLSNTKSRRDRLTPEQHHALRKLGIDWAT
ncbi:helicase associated protein [Streptomyces sp. CEV 2-1]|nr:helicase associated protein [Streptomyces sp. CEV 2-1]